MGGRGTYAVGNNVPYTYKTVGKIDGVKVLQPIDEKRSLKLPEEAHSSLAYISLYGNGTVKQIRTYKQDRTPYVDIEFSTHQGKKILHAHDYIGGERQKARSLTREEIAKYGKFFGGKQ